MSAADSNTLENRFLCIRPNYKKEIISGDNDEYAIHNLPICAHKCLAFFNRYFIIRLKNVGIEPHQGE